MHNTIRNYFEANPTFNGFMSKYNFDTDEDDSFTCVLTHDHLIDFAKWWLNEVSLDATPVKQYGLCYLFREWLTANVELTRVDENDFEDLCDSLTYRSMHGFLENLFMECFPGIDVTYPFNDPPLSLDLEDEEMREAEKFYTFEAFKRSMHLNTKRIEFINAIIESQHA